MSAASGDTSLTLRLACGARRLALRRRSRARCSTARRPVECGVRERTAAIIARVRTRATPRCARWPSSSTALRSMRSRCRGANGHAALDALAPDAPARDGALGGERRARAPRLSCPPCQETESEPGIVVGRRPDPLAARRRVRPRWSRGVPEQCPDGRGAGARGGRGRDRALLAAGARQRPRQSDVVLAAAALAGADRVFALGGAGAIAAMAYGTESVPRVDRIVGPGNAYVAEAKLQVSSAVAIDSPAGPSELLVLCDESADPALVARELLAQAEHDPLAAVVAVTTSERAARAVRRRARRPARDAAARGTICSAALAGQGAVLWAHSLDDGDRVRERVCGGAPVAASCPSSMRRSRRCATRAPCSSGERLGGVRRLHDRREPRAAHRRPRPLVLRTVHARLRALDHVSARVARCGGRVWRTTSASLPTPRGCPGHAMRGARLGHRQEAR